MARYLTKRCLYDTQYANNELITQAVEPVALDTQGATEQPKDSVISSKLALNPPGIAVCRLRWPHAAGVRRTFSTWHAVNGKNFYGTAPVLPPSLTTPGPLDVGRGRFIPTTSVDQFRATLGSWFGVSDANLLTIFPNLTNFNASTRNLGFMQQVT